MGVTRGGRFGRFHPKKRRAFKMDSPWSSGSNLVLVERRIPTISGADVVAVEDIGEREGEERDARRRRRTFGGRRGKRRERRRREEGRREKTEER